ncbi:MAG: Ribosome-recycling factor [Firmicutes bacterium ADurb.Bin193]|nr:MAG: Ribosome-recycling factor [Firmicutes bacterium ADurb.Bin193]
MDDALLEFDRKMEKSIGYFVAELATLRAGRANPSILDKVTVEYYGTPVPIAQVANISVPEPHLLVIQPWDASILSDIERAINKSDIGINPQNDGKVIRLNFPTPTEERRKELVKTLHKKSEEGKVHIRSIRREAIDFVKNMKKKNEITEDDLTSLEAEIQKLTDTKITEIDQITEKKEKEILEI